MNILNYDVCEAWMKRRIRAEMGMKAFRVLKNIFIHEAGRRVRAGTSGPVRLRGVTPSSLDFEGLSRESLLNQLSLYGFCKFHAEELLKGLEELICEKFDKGSVYIQGIGVVEDAGGLWHLEVHYNQPMPVAI